MNASGKAGLFFQHTFMSVASITKAQYMLPFLCGFPMSEGNTELYYAEMEATRNELEDAYFAARPQLMRTITEQCLFRAGFERAWAVLWHKANGSPEQ